MSTRAFTFTLIFFACMLAMCVQAAIEENGEAALSSPKQSSPSPKQSPPSPKQSPLSPKQSPPSPKGVLSTEQETPMSRAIKRIPKHIDDQPISLRHKIMKSKYDTPTEKEQQRYLEDRKYKARKQRNGYTGKNTGKVSSHKNNRQANKEKVSPY